MTGARRKDSRRIVFSGADLQMPLIVHVGYHSLRMPISLHEHTHEGFELTYLADGEVTWVVVGGARLHLTGGDMAVTQPGALHHGEWNIIRPCTLYWIIIEPQRADAERHTPFTRRFLDDLHARLASVGNAVTRPEGDVPQLFDRLHASMVLCHDGLGDEFLRPRMRAILAQVLVEAACSFSVHRMTHRLTPLVRDAVRTIENRFAEPIGVSAVARAVGLSPSRLHAVFKKETGQTPADFLRRTRCTRAREALLRSNESITAIAHSHGFSSSQYFAQCFRQYTGMAPRAFRKRIGRTTPASGGWATESGPRQHTH